MLLSHRASVTACDSDGQTPLHKAAAGQSAAVIRLLLAASPAPDLCAADTRGATPLDLARAAGGGEGVALLSVAGSVASVAAASTSLPAVVVPLSEHHPGAGPSNEANLNNGQS